MSFKFKKQVKDNNGKDPTVFKGLEALEVPKGTLLEVIKAPDVGVGDIIMRTDSAHAPFISITDELGDKGGLWGDAIENYIFKTVTRVVNV